MQSLCDRKIVLGAVVPPDYRRIDKKYGELELALELDVRVLLIADETDSKMLNQAS